MSEHLLSSNIKAGYDSLGLGVLSDTFWKDEKMYIVGIDITKRSHEAVIIDSDGNILKKAFNFKNNHEGFNKLLSIMQKFGKPDEFIIGMESTSHYWLALYHNFIVRDLMFRLSIPYNPTHCVECISARLRMTNMILSSSLK